MPTHTFGAKPTTNSMCLKCAVQLGIPDLIHNHAHPFMPISQLTASLPINPAKANDIGRLMSILTHSGFFHGKKPNEEEEVYALTYAGRLLVKDNPLSMTSSLLLSLDPIQMEPWHHLSTWFQNDHPTAYHTAHGMAIWEYASRRNPKLNNLFNNAMLCDSRLVSSAMLHKFKWAFEGIESLVDVGGGTGTMAKAIAQSFPSMKCTVLDLPHVVAGLKGINNLNYIGGNMFEAIPQADAVLLKWILHDWSDEESVRILKKCKEAISVNGKTGKVIIIDMVMMEQHKQDCESVETQLLFDMLMMIQSTQEEKETSKNGPSYFTRQVSVTTILLPSWV